ncbi:hypothetical protein [Paraglaciecola sp.]|uniref:hypothetical protein n=1 Tax=Paraglaciecola sp. TaxID=1920173 RepID=UPI0030F46825
MQCPPEDYPHYKLTAKVGAATLCFWDQDLMQRDSCPDSSAAGDFILPVGSNTDATMCVSKSDGSYCGYRKSGEAYVSDVELNCYQGEQPTYQFETPTPEPNNCSKIGTVTACPADPEAKCGQSGIVNGQMSYSACEAGCGYSDLTNSGTSTFMCLTGDDGLPPVDEPEPVDPPETPPTTGEKSITDRIDITNSLLGGLKTTNEGIKTGVNKAVTELTELNKELKNNSAGLGALNDKTDGILTEIRKIASPVFTTTAQGRSTGGIAGLFDQSKIDAAKLQAEAKKTEYLDFIETIKSDASAAFTLSNPSANFESRTLVISGQTYNISMSRFSDNFSLMGTVVMFLAALATISILLGGKR